MFRPLYPVISAVILGAYALVVDVPTEYSCKDLLVPILAATSLSTVVYALLAASPPERRRTSPDNFFLVFQSRKPSAATAMPFNLTISNADLLMNQPDLLYRLNLELTTRRMDLEKRIKGKKFTEGDFRGTVVAVAQDGLRVRNDTTKEERRFPLTRQKISQLLA